MTPFSFVTLHGHIPSSSSASSTLFLGHIRHHSHTILRLLVVSFIFHVGTLKIYRMATSSSAGIIFQRNNNKTSTPTTPFNLASQPPSITPNYNTTITETSVVKADDETATTTTTLAPTDTPIELVTTQSSLVYLNDDLPKRFRREILDEADRCV